MPVPPSTPPRRGWLGPLLLALVAVGMVTAVAGRWRPGLLLVGVALLAAAVARACLDPGLVAPLTVRSRWLDVLFLLVAAAALIAPDLALG